MRNMTVNALAECTQISEMEMILQESLHQMAVVKCTFAVYSSSAACVLELSFSSMVSLCVHHVL